MGRQKLLIPWGDTTVLGKVVQALRDAEVKDIILVTNPEVAAQLTDHREASLWDGLRITLNATGEMLTSIQTGLRELISSPKSDRTTVEFGGDREGALICLGDQPQMEERSVRAVCDAFLKGKSNIVVPSYRMRRGHPWLAASPLWDEILALDESRSMRGFLNAHADGIEYVNLDTPTILQDLDTPEDYLKYKPGM